MIDTISIKITDFQINNFELFKEKNNNDMKSFFENPMDFNCQLNAHLKRIKDGIYRPNIFVHSNYYILPTMYIKFSVSKLLFNNNLIEPKEDNFKDIINKLVNILNDLEIIVERETIKTALLKRIDFSKNIILVKGVMYSDFIKMLKEIRFNRMKVFYENDKFIKFYSKSLSILFYDKIEEMKKHKITIANFSEIVLMAEHRILRIEIQIKGDYGINKRLANDILKLSKKTKLTFQQVYCEKVFKQVFEYILKELHRKLPNIIVDGRENEQLKELYGNKTDEIARKMLILKSQKDCGNYEKGIEKAIELYGEKFVEKNKCILVNNENLQNIFLRILEEIKDYKPLFNTS